MRKILFILLLTSVFSCKNEKYKGYSEADNGVFYKLHSIGDGTKNPKSGDYVEMQINYKKMNDSIFWSSKYSNTFGVVFMEYTSSVFGQIFSKLTDGDSISCIMNKDTLFRNLLKAEIPVFLEYEENVKADVKIISILNKKEYYDRLDEYQYKLETAEQNEELDLRAFIDSTYTSIRELEEGLYVEQLKEGKGEEVLEGKNISMAYKGFFLDGRPFDSTNGKTFEFVYGQDDQVLEGIEKGIAGFKEGSKAKIIISSRLAFGQNGSTDGIVPPFTSVVYEVEILKVK